MSEISKERLAAGRALAAALVSPAVREMFARNAYDQSSPIVVALDEDLVVDVIGQIQERCAGTALLAVFDPKGVHEMRWVRVKPGMKCDAIPGDSEVGATATIGMLAQYVAKKNNQKSYTFKVASNSAQFGVDLERLAVLA